jgi:hypothetical protein
MHPAFLPCSFGQMVTTAPAGLTITPSGLISGTGRSLAPAPSRLPEIGRWRGDHDHVRLGRS